MYIRFELWIDYLQYVKSNFSVLYKEPMITDEGGFKNKLFKHIYYFQLPFFLKFKQICSKIELQKLFKTPSFEPVGKVDANIPLGNYYYSYL